MALFDYNHFLEELKEKEDKKEIVERFSKYYGSQDKVSVYNAPFYKDYLAKFDLPLELCIPNDLDDDLFDFDLLAKLTVGSFSSQYKFMLDEDPKKVHLFIKVTSGNQQVTKEISELWSFQILRLFEIYIEEQINLFSMMAEDEDEKRSVLAEQSVRLKMFKDEIAPLVKQEDLNKAIEDLL